MIVIKFKMETTLVKNLTEIMQSELCEKSFDDEWNWKRFIRGMECYLVGFCGMSYTIDDFTIGYLMDCQAPNIEILEKLRELGSNFSRSGELSAITCLM
jgi:hypothetical protein